MLVVTAALCGGTSRREQNPNVPCTPEEFSREARSAEDAGAAIVHVHFRDPDTGLPSLDRTIIREVIQAIREKSGVLLNLRTGKLGPFLPRRGAQDAHRGAHSIHPRRPARRDLAGQWRGTVLPTGGHGQFSPSMLAWRRMERAAGFRGRWTRRPIAGVPG